MRSSNCLAFVALLLALGACAGPRWEEIREQDSAAGYRRYLSESPRGKHAAEARERLAALQLERAPSVEALTKFRAEHPASTALPELEKLVEARAFDAARAQATPDAYARFLAAFPNGALRARAVGNQVYVTAGGFAGRPDELAAFLRQHPESDYALEASRAVAGVESRRNEAFARIALVIEIAPEVGEASRLRAVFAERAREIYAAAGRTLVDGPADAVLRIRHGERAVAASDGSNLLAKPGTLAETDVSLEPSSGGAPVFRDRIAVRVPAGDHRDGGSALFAPTAKSYWDRFFVPVASWPTSSARRSSSNVAGRMSGVGADLGRAIAIMPDGGYREVDLADPASPRVVGTFVHQGSPAQYAGAVSASGRIVLFGEDGLEVVARQAGGLRRVATFDRGSVGAVSGVEFDGTKLLIAGTRGLLRAPLEGGPVERVIDRPLRGIARSGDTLYLVDDQRLYGGPIADPRPATVSALADFGRALDPRALRIGGSIAVVVGTRGLATFAVAGKSVSPLARIRPETIGSISDAAVVGTSVFALGDRGLLVLDPRSGRVVDSVDVEGRQALGAAGGHVITIGGDRLDVVDVTPWTASSLPASPSH